MYRQVLVNVRKEIMLPILYVILPSFVMVGQEDLMKRKGIKKYFTYHASLCIFPFDLQSNRNSIERLAIKILR